MSRLNSAQLHFITLQSRKTNAQGPQLSNDQRCLSHTHTYIHTYAQARHAFQGAGSVRGAHFITDACSKAQGSAHTYPLTHTHTHIHTSNILDKKQRVTTFCEVGNFTLSMQLETTTNNASHRHGRHQQQAAVCSTHKRAQDTKRGKLSAHKKDEKQPQRSGARSSVDGHASECGT